MPLYRNDNPFSEALFRTCKYRPEWPAKGFSDIEAAREWVKRFADWYNGEHLHSAIRFVTPNMRHAGQEQTVLAARACLWAETRAARPERWSGKTRNWAPAGDVWLNLERDNGDLKIRDAA